MEVIPIRVESYSGYKADERPVSFYWNGKKYEIKEIVDRWYERNHIVDWLATDYFKVLTTTGKQWILKHDRETDQWSLVR
jgi:hypothetical protein